MAIGKKTESVPEYRERRRRRIASRESVFVSRAERGFLPIANRQSPIAAERSEANLSRFILRLFRWRVVGRLPDLPKFVAIGAPHTSNWDFPLALLTARVLRVRIRWIGKAGIFRFPWGPLMRWLGGIPSERTGSEGLVAAMSRAFAESDRLVLAIAPEGTRKAVPYWKSGFYRIAHGVGVPIVPVLIDGTNREVRVGDPLMPTGDVKADMDRLREFYSGVVGIKPEGSGPVVLQDE